MNKDAKVYVAGHRGLVGSALIRQLQKQGYTNVIYRTHDELDLTNQVDVAAFFRAEKPEYVLLAAAKVGGIHANNTYPAEFIHQNLAIQTNVIHHSYLHGVKRLLFLGSSCIYPKDSTQPIKEEYLLTGPLEPTNRPYALAKIAGIEMCWSYNRQYGTQFLAAMPTNLYGPRDNYHPENSHVIPALIRRFHEAKINGNTEVAIWGTGTPKREFLYSDDMAEACLYLINLADEKFMSIYEGSAPPVVNVGVGADVTVAALAELVKKAVGYEGVLTFDVTKPDGTMRKMMDVSLMRKLGWEAKTKLNEGLSESYMDFLS